MMVVRVVLEIAMSARDCRWTLGREGGREGGGTVSAADSDRRAIDSDGGQAAVAVIRGEV